MAAENTIVLRFATRALERAREVGRAVLVTVEKGGTAAKAARRELQAAVRERLQAAKALASERRQAARGPLLATPDQPRDRFTGVREGLSRARTVGVGLSSLASGGAISTEALAILARSAIPQAALVVLSKQVFDLLKAEFVQGRDFEERIRALDELAQLRVDRALETLGERVKKDPAFARAAAREAGDALRARRAQEARVGLAPDGLLEVLGAGD